MAAYYYHNRAYWTFEAGNDSYSTTPLYTEKSGGDRKAKSTPDELGAAFVKNDVNSAYDASARLWQRYVATQDSQTMNFSLEGIANIGGIDILGDEMRVAVTIDIYWFDVLNAMHYYDSDFKSYAWDYGTHTVQDTWAINLDFVSGVEFGVDLSLITDYKPQMPSYDFASEYSCDFYNSFNIISVTGVSIVPIPGAVWLLGSGLIGLVGLRKRFKKE
jgi:hypothetical protein